MRRARAEPTIRSFTQLARALDDGLLVKTFQAGRPLFTVVPGAMRCDLEVANEALARGWLEPIDAGLFGAATAQSWKLITPNNSERY